MLFSVSFEETLWGILETSQELAMTKNTWMIQGINRIDYNLLVKDSIC